MARAEAEFIEAVCADPASDGPRLVYADWLDDRGDPRGQFIRLHCALANAESDSALAIEIEARLAELNRYRARWEAPLKGLVGGMEWSRGFVETVNIETRKFLRRAPELFQLAPIRHVRFLDVGGSLSALVESPFLSRLHGLTIFAQHIDERLTRALVDSPYLSQLRSLCLGRNRVGDRGAERLAWSPTFRNLVDLDLSDNAIGDLGARAIAGSSNLSNLNRLELRRNEITRAGLGELCGSTALCELRELGLALNYVGAVRDWSPPAEGIVQLQRLNLTENGLAPDGIDLITRLPGLNDLRELAISINNIGNAGADLLARWPKSSTLRTLIAANTNIGDDGAQALARSVYLFNLSELDLSENPIHDSGAFELLSPPGMPRLKRLSLPYLGLTPKMRRALATRYGG